MTAPHIVDPAGLLGEALAEASPDLMRHLLQSIINALLSADADAVVGAEYGRPDPGRVAQRNGYRHRPLDTRVGTVDVAVPKLRQGTYWQVGLRDIGWPTMPRHAVPFDGEALRAARVRRGLTQHGLARLVDVAGGERVSRWELGVTTPRAVTVGRLASALGVSVDDLMPSVGAASGLRELRTRAGLSPRDLAEATHMSVSTIQRWESGRTSRPLPDPTLQALATALGVSVEDVAAAISRARQA